MTGTLSSGLTAFAKFFFWLYELRHALSQGQTQEGWPRARVGAGQTAGHLSEGGRASAPASPDLSACARGRLQAWGLKERSQPLPGKRVGRLSRARTWPLGGHLTGHGGAAPSPHRPCPSTAPRGPSPRLWAVKNLTLTKPNLEPSALAAGRGLWGHPQADAIQPRKLQAGSSLGFSSGHTDGLPPPSSPDRGLASSPGHSPGATAGTDAHILRAVLVQAAPASPEAQGPDAGGPRRGPGLWSAWTWPHAGQVLFPGLCSLHPAKAERGSPFPSQSDWRGLSRPPAEVSLVAFRPFCSCPMDFEKSLASVPLLRAPPTVARGPPALGARCP